MISALVGLCVVVHLVTRWLLGQSRVDSTAQASAPPIWDRASIIAPVGLLLLGVAQVQEGLSGELYSQVQAGCWVVISGMVMLANHRFASSQTARWSPLLLAFVAAGVAGAGVILLNQPPRALLWPWEGGGYVLMCQMGCVAYSK